MNPDLLTVFVSINVIGLIAMLVVTFAKTEEK
jgi:hypothetical protein